MNRNKNAVNDSNKKSFFNQNKGKGSGKGKGNSSRNNNRSNKSNKNYDGKGRSDETQHDGVPGKQDASLYFGDLQLAEDNSYVSSRNVLDIRRKMPGTNFYYPTVFVHGFNPCPGVSYVDFKNFIIYPSGLKLAANQIKTAIIANNGRISNYTSVDITILLLMIGEFISMTEYMRRIFGAKYKFAELNRDIPKSFVEAMGIDYDDFIDNLNSYQSRANKLINYGAPIVIPMDKIPYLRKCRDLYQDIYQDTAAGQMCYHINVPRTTWHLHEDETFGTRLETVGVTQDLSKFYVYEHTGLHVHRSKEEAQKYVQRIRKWKFGDFLNKVYEPLVMSLTTSETFNNIYSDLRAAKFQSVYPFEFWRPELIETSYECPVVESEDWLNIYHNARYAGDVSMGLDYNFNGEDSPVMPKLNDVVTDPKSDDLRYNPVLVRANASDYLLSADHKLEYVLEPEYILDFKEVTPPVNKRVDAMMYTAWPRGHKPEGDAEFNSMEFQCNWLLPDHYMTNMWVYVGEIHPDVPGDFHFFPMSVRNSITKPSAITSVEGGIKVYNEYEAIENGAIVLHQDADFTLATDNLSLISGRLQIVNYLEGSNIGLGASKTNLPSDSERPIYLEKDTAPIGNLDQWYVLDLIKFENMFDHVYQYLFTADNIVK